MADALLGSQEVQYLYYNIYLCREGVPKRVLYVIYVGLS